MKGPTLASLGVAIMISACGESDAAVLMPPVVVQSPLRLPGAVVQGASTRWYLASHSPPRYGDPVPVESLRKPAASRG